MGHGTWDTGHTTHDTGHATWDTGHRTWDMGHALAWYGTWDMGHKRWDVGYGTQAMAYGTQDVGHALAWHGTWDMGHGTRHTGHRTQDMGQALAQAGQPGHWGGHREWSLAQHGCGPGSPLCCGILGKVVFCPTSKPWAGAGAGAGSRLWYLHRGKEKIPCLTNGEQLETGKTQIPRAGSAQPPALAASSTNTRLLEMINPEQLSPRHSWGHKQRVTLCPRCPHKHLPPGQGI